MTTQTFYVTQSPPDTETLIVDSRTTIIQFKTPGSTSTTGNVGGYVVVLTSYTGAEPSEEDLEDLEDAEETLHRLEQEGLGAFTSYSDYRRPQQ